MGEWGTSFFPLRQSCTQPYYYKAGISPIFSNSQESAQKSSLFRNVLRALTLRLLLRCFPFIDGRSKLRDTGVSSLFSSKIKSHASGTPIMARREDTMDDKQVFTNQNTHTYHCICSQLILATTSPLSKFSRRSGSALDKAHIVPLLTSSSTSSGDDERSEKNKQSLVSEFSQCAVLVDALLDPKAIIVRREDGFEKRYLQHCGRCRLVIGYHLDSSQYEGAKGSGREDSVVYILPGSLMSTEDMSEGKDITPYITFPGVSSAEKV